MKSWVFSPEELKDPRPQRASAALLSLAISCGCSPEARGDQASMNPSGGGGCGKRTDRGAVLKWDRQDFTSRCLFQHPCLATSVQIISKFPFPHVLNEGP